MSNGGSHTVTLTIYSFSNPNFQMCKNFAATMYFEGKKFVQEFTPEKDLKAYSGHHGTDYFNPFLSTNCATKNFGEPVANVGLSRRS